MLYFADDSRIKLHSQNDVGHNTLNRHERLTVLSVGSASKTEARAALTNAAKCVLNMTDRVSFCPRFWQLHVQVSSCFDTIEVPSREALLNSEARAVVHYLILRRCAVAKAVLHACVPSSRDILGSS